MAIERSGGHRLNGIGGIVHQAEAIDGNNTLDKIVTLVKDSFRVNLSILTIIVAILKTMTQPRLLTLDRQK